MIVKIFTEGGGNIRRTRVACRRGFGKFFENAGLGGRMPRVIPCGGRDQTYKDFCIAIRNAGPNESPLLLVDSEAPVTAPPWRHLGDRDGWTRPPQATDEHVHLMVQCMETWFLADKARLAEYFGQGFAENALPANPNLEDVAKDALLDGLKNATRYTKKQKVYDKGAHSFELLGLIDPAKVTAASPHAKRLMETLTQRVR